MAYQIFMQDMLLLLHNRDMFFTAVRFVAAEQCPNVAQLSVRYLNLTLKRSVLKLFLASI